MGLKMYVPIKDMVNNRIEIPYFKSQIIAFSAFPKTLFLVSANSGNFTFGDYTSKIFVEPIFLISPKATVCYFLELSFLLGVGDRFFDTMVMCLMSLEQ